jgi:probable HAF family extracellular repeat protein
MIFHLKRLAVTTLFWTLASNLVSAQVSFKGFGVPNAFINDISADGSVVVGILLGTGTVPNPSGDQAFRWTAAGGVENIGGHMDKVSISRDGTTIVGSTLDAQGNKNAAIWQGGKSWKLLGGVPGGVPQGFVLSIGLGVSGDGSVIVGLAYLPSSQELGTQFHGFRWDPAKGMVDLGTMRKGGTSNCFGISADGNTIIGYERSPKGADFLESPSGSSGVIFWRGVERPLHAFGRAGEAFAINWNGTIIVGRLHPLGGRDLPNGTFFTTTTTYMYTAWDGRFEDLAAVLLQSSTGLGFDYASMPTAVSDDGQVVGGTTGVSDHLPYLWTRATGMVLITDYLTANGLTVHQGWQKLTDVSYISPNGKLIAGTGIDPQGVAGSWIVNLP